MMNNELRPYEEYVDTRDVWHGKLPKHWDCVKLGMKFRERRTKVSDKEFMPLSVTKNGIVPQLSTAAKSNDGDNRKLVKQGDFVINSRSDRKGSSGLSNYNGSVSLINIVLQPYEVNSKYAHYLFKSNSFIEEFYRNGRGIVADLWTTRFYEMRNIYIPIPSLPEQDQIVKYLDNKLAKINKFIKAKKKLIAALKEQKQAIINQAVTKGFDSKVRMKPSGIEWLGDIPEHWTMVQLKRLVKTVKTGGTPSGADEKYFEPIGFNWFTPSDFNDELYLSNSNRQLSNVGKSEVNIFPQGTVMMIGIGATMGKISISEKKCSCNQQINAILCSENIIPEFLVYFMRAVRTHIFAIAKYTTLPILNQEETKKIMVPSIPCEEQKKIVLKINESVAVYDAGIKKIEHEIGLVLEYKSSLVSEVVTGKVDVQHVFIEKPKKVGRDESDIDEELTYGGETDIEEGDE
ncbi:restriction endonuclease subunit S [Pectinatus brassicae]|uniref:Type I restriction enzyme S subunit n=1 Tax=Pectinatus brassicae TaxID=862415 RepID=A0A840UH28_9FIRM|nr:restriction endonuclease subunit S [Pectinatus brassicae]MBB5336426.1 type I restriction enzyme S subunit [Pectinatus brassicae]